MDEKMDNAIDLLWLRLVQCYSALVVVFIAMMALGIDPAWTPVAALVLTPWCIQALKVRRLIKEIKRNN